MMTHSSSPAVVGAGAAPPASTMLPPLPVGRYAPPPELSALFEIQVNAATHPFLDGHRLKGCAVVPAVLALEWMARAARSLGLSCRLRSCRELRVLRGIRVERFEGDGLRLLVECRRRSEHEIAAEIRSPEGPVHYRAIIELDDGRAPAAPPPTVAAPLLPAALTLYPPTVYDGETLFHEGPFRVIDSAVQISDEGSSGTVRGVRAMSWPGALWLTDVAALDGALQIAVLWARHALGGASLPTGIGRYQTWAEGAVGDRLQVVVRGRVMHSLRALCDVDLVVDGGVAAQIRELELHLRPRPPAAAR